MAQEPIDREGVLYVAELCRLELTDPEVDAMTTDLLNILKHVETLNELDTTNVPPTSHAVDLPSRLRDDEVGDHLPVDIGLRDAPERIGDGFGVPKIIE